MTPWILARAAMLAAAAGMAATGPARARQRIALPAPTGPSAVGTAIYSLVDSARVELASGAPGRRLLLQLWYPAIRGTGAGTAAYMPDAGAIDSMIARGYNHLEPAELEPLRALRTHARLDARVLPGERRPVLVLSHGQGVSRSQYTVLAEDLASHGYLVATVDHPYGGFVVYPDGRAATLADDPAALDRDSVLSTRAVEWAEDASFVLDEIARRESAPGRRFSAVVDTTRAGALGHSFGGAALEACRLDPRFRACADLDGLPFGPVRELGVGRPTLVMLSQPVYSDAELAARGRTREEWEAMGRARASALASILAKSPASPAFVVEIRGTGHMSFSDAPFVLPSMITHFGGTPIDAARGQELVGAYIRDFFDRFLRGGRGELLNGAGERPAEVLVRRVSSPRLSLHACSILDGAVPARCGTFRVREDRAVPGGRELDLNLIVVPAESPSPAPDPVFVLAGGPGQVGTELTELVARLDRVHRERDIVFVDQRGTGASNALVCPGAGEREVGYGPEDDAYWADCLHALREHADPLHYTTADAVEDLDELRAALGYARVNLIGGSYGTRVAQFYLRRHPARVRSAVLWAVAPMRYDIPVEGGLAVQAALERLLADCAADASCGAAFPRLEVQLDSLLAALASRPERVKVGGEAVEMSITPELFGQTLLALLFNAGHLRKIPALLDQVARGEWTTFAAIAAQVQEGKETEPDGLYLSVVCSEDIPQVQRARLGEFRGRMGALLRTSAEELLYRCARWPVAPGAAALNAPFSSEIPVLLLSGEADPATPPQGAERALEYLSNARHVQVPATSHGPIFPGCVPELVADFLASPHPERVEAGCVEELHWPPFAVPATAARR